VPRHPYEHGFDLRLIPGKLAEPLRWPTAKTVFVNSMSDLFQDRIPVDYIVAVAQVMQRAPWHIFQVLTKRSERLRDLLLGPLQFASGLKHIWWGVSVEDKRYGVPRIDDLRAAPAAVRFLSIEPLLEDIGKIDLSGIDWVIVGGESGPGARLMLKPWVESILHQCNEAGVPFFFKQWGGVQKKIKGRKLNERTYDSLPPRVVVPIAAREARLQLIGDFERMAANWSDAPLAQNPTRSSRLDATAAE
jgi:protein gp37